MFGVFKLTRNLTQCGAKLITQCSMCTKPGSQIRVTNFEKRMIVWTGKYKTIAKVPDLVPVETLNKAKNKARIRCANYMMALTLLGCLGMVYAGKKAASRGESVSQYNLDWHKQIDDEGKNKKE